MYNNATKADFKNATGIDASSFIKKVDPASLKSNLGKLDIDKLNNVTTTLSNLERKVNKLLPVPVDLSKLREVAKNDVVKKAIMLRSKILKVNTRYF